MNDLKVTVTARTYSLTHDSGKISFKWNSNKNLGMNDKRVLVRKLELLIAKEIEDHEILHHQ